MYPRRYAADLEQLVGVPPGTFDRRFALTATHAGMVPWQSIEWEDEEMRRRSFLAGVTAVAGGLGLSAVAPTRGSAAARRVGMAEVRQIRAVTEQFRSTDYRYGGGEILASATLCVDRVATLLHAKYAENVGRGLHQAVADLQQLVGWAALDSGNVPEARRQWLHAEASAGQAGDLPLLARVAYCHAQEARGRGDHRAMAEHLDHAMVTAEEGGATATVSAMLASFAAMAHAALGEDHQALTLIDAAGTVLVDANSTEDPPWVHHFDAAEFGAATAYVHRELARRAKRYRPDALARALVAVELYDCTQARSRALVTATAAGTAFLVGESAEGVRLATQARNESEGLRSARIRQRLRREMAPYREIPAVRELLAG
jgi:hypothetical protein